MNILIVYAHPEPTSLTRQMVDVTAETLSAAGHTVVHSDLYGMKWKAVYDADDFPMRENPERLSFIAESGHAYAGGHQTPDVIGEQQKLLAADAVVLQFPLWWYGVPAILKGWIERVYAFSFAYGYQNGSNQFRFGEGILKGKRALVNVQTGGPAADYGPRGINGPIEQLLFPLTHGALFYPGMDVLPTHAVYGAGRVSTAEEVEAIKAAWRERLAGLFTDTPIPFRSQNGGDFPDHHTWPTMLRRAKPASPRTLPIEPTREEQRRCRSVEAARVGGHISLNGVLTGRAGDVPTAMLMARQQRLQGLIVGSRPHHPASPTRPVGEGRRRDEQQYGSRYHDERDRIAARLSPWPHRQFHHERGDRRRTDRR